MAAGESRPGAGPGEGSSAAASTAASAGPRATDRLLGAAPTSLPDASGLLRDVLAARGLASPADLGSPPGAGATTLWKVNAAQMLVVSHTSREAVIDDAFECGRIAATAALSAVHARAAQPLFARLTCACPAGASDAARRSLIDGVAVAMDDVGRRARRRADRRRARRCASTCSSSASCGRTASRGPTARRRATR